MWEDWREMTASGAPPFRVSHQQTLKGKASILTVQKEKQTIQNKSRNLVKKKLSHLREIHIFVHGWEIYKLDHTERSTWPQQGIPKIFSFQRDERTWPL